MGQTRPKYNIFCITAMYIITQNYLLKVISSNSNKMGHAHGLSLLNEQYLVKKIHMDKMNVS